MTAKPRTTKPRRDIPAEITSQLITAIKADPGKPSPEPSGRHQDLAIASRPSDLAVCLII